MNMCVDLVYKYGYATVRKFVEGVYCEVDMFSASNEYHRTHIA